MKTEIIFTDQSIKEQAIINPFDAGRFARMLNERSKKSFWKQFMEGVERKRREIHRDLMTYRKS